MNEEIQQNICDSIFVKANDIIEPLVCLMKANCYDRHEDIVPSYYRIINGNYGYVYSDFKAKEKRDKVFDLAVEKLVKGEKLIDFDKLREELDK